MPRPVSSWPWLAGGVALLAGLITASDAASAWAVLERGGGGWWRFWTTHAVHVSASHLLGSGLVWLVAGAAVERISRGSLAVLLVAGAPGIAWAALTAEADMGSYVGLSGLASGCVVWLALELVRAGRAEKRDRLLGAILLVAVAGRIAWDLLGNGRGWVMTLDASEAEEVRVARYAHFAGAVAGALCWAGYAWTHKAISKLQPTRPDPAG